MKKLQKLAALVLTGSFAFSLAACGGDEPSGNGNKVPDPGDVKTEQVTQAQWNAAFDINDVQNVTVKMSEKYAGEEAYDIYEFDGKKVRNVSVGYEMSDGPDSGTSTSAAAMVKTEDTFFYSTESDGVYKYTYNKDNKTWGKELTEYYPAISNFTEDLSKLREAYSKFTYTASANAYVTDQQILGNGQNYDSLSVKIVGGKLSVIQLKMTLEEAGVSAEAEMTYQFYNYGSTKVTLPVIKDEIVQGGGQVTKDGWTKALSVERLGNVTITNENSLQTGHENPVMKVDTANKAIYQSNISSSGKIEHIIAFAEEAYHRFECVDDGEWTYSQREDDDAFDRTLENFILMLELLNYDDFRFDAKTSTYILNDYSYPGADIKADITVKFNNGYLQYLETVATDGKDTMTQKMTFTDYGTTTVEIPDVQIPDVGGPITEAQWRDALSESAFVNCTLASTIDSESINIPELVIKLDLGNGIVYAQDLFEEGDESYVIEYIYTDQKVYSRKVDEINWEEADSADGLNTVKEECLSLFGMFSEMFGKFRYDGIAYVADHITINELETTFDMVELAFEDGKLVKLVLRAGDLTQIILISDYGATKVESPVA